MMKLHAIGMAVRHTADFVIDRPAGSGDDLLIIFKTPAELIIGGEVLRAHCLYRRYAPVLPRFRRYIC